MEQQFDYHLLLLRTEGSSLKFPSSKPCFVPTNSCLSTTGMGQKFDADRWSGREEMSRKKRTIIAKNLPNSFPTATKYKFKHKL
jgi:hypothetical protein